MAKNKKDETELQTTGTTAVQAFDYGEDAVPMGQVAPGYENQGSDDTAIPFIVLLQANSPVVVEQKVEGAQAGMFLNTVTQQLWSNKDPLYIVPALTRHEFVEYVPRDAGGGFVGRHEIDSDVVLQAKADAKKNGLAFGEYYVGENELTETFYIFGVACTLERAIGMAIVPFKSTGIKCYKHWMTQVRSHTVDTPNGKKIPPLFAHLGKLTTDFRKNNDGSFFVPVYTPAIDGNVGRSCLSPDDERFKMAKALKNLVDSGTAKVNYDQQNTSGTGGKDGQPPF